MFFFFFIYIFFICLECFIRTSLYFFMINAKASNKKTTTAKTLRKREKEFQLKLDFDINIEYKVCCIWCSDCKKWKPRIKETKKFSSKWIKGTENAVKHTIEKHVRDETHLQAVKLSKRSELGAEVYQDEYATCKKFFKAESSRQGYLRSKIQYYVLHFEKVEIVYSSP